jgi:hypothetical protein
VVGGLAVNAWGVVRGTKDVDVIIATDPENLRRVAAMAVAAGGRVQKGEALGRLDVVQGWRECPTSRT